MKRKESCQSVVSIDGSSDDKLLERWTQQGRDREDLGGDLSGPVTPLVPGQQVACQSQAQHQPRERETKPPVHLSGTTVGSRYYDLQQVQDEQHDHGVRSVVVQAADKPTQLHLVLYEVDALPRRLHRGAVGGPKTKTCEELNQEGEKQGASPDVAPSGTTWDRFVEEVSTEATIACAVIEPVPQSTHETVICSLIPLRNS